MIHMKLFIVVYIVVIRISKNASVLKQVELALMVKVGYSMHVNKYLYLSLYLSILYIYIL